MRYPQACYLFCFCLIFFAGCTTAPVRLEKTGPQGPGVYHKVAKGETLWRIAKAYGVNIEDIIRVNNIPNVAQIETNQLIFIPGARETKTVPVAPETTTSSEFIWPVKGKILTYFGEYRNHSVAKGIDILAQEGEKVLAARSGRVVFADRLNGYGQTVILDNGDGFYTVYAQNAALLVTLGQSVITGTPIATVGKRKNLAYLHFEIRKNDNPDNPLYYLP